MINRRGRKHRFHAIRTFDLFIGLAGNDRQPGWFHEIAEEDPSHEFFQTIYSFCVVPGGAMGGMDRRVLEVFYGARPVDSVIDLKHQDFAGKPLAIPQPQRRFITEGGAALRYTRTARGSVIVTLYPARSEDHRPREDFIVLQHLRDATSLTGKPRLRKHFRILIAYCECTSLDGAPQAIDWVLTFWIRFTKPIVVNGKVTRRRIVAVLLTILQWSLTVGFSGALLAVVQGLMKTP